MPMIDVVVPAGLLPADRSARLLRDLARAVIRHEGHAVESPYAENTAAYLHELPPAAVATAAQDAAPVARVQVTTPPAALGRDAQKALVADLTALVADAAGDPALAGRTWVTLTEAAEGGWGVSGFALGREEFAALAAGRSAAAPA